MIEIYTGDFRKITEYAKDQAFIFIDPPYNQNKPYKGVDDNLSKEDYQQLIADTWKLIEKLGNRAAILVSKKILPLWTRDREDWQLVIIHKKAKGVKVGGMYNQYVPLIITCPPMVPCDDFWDDIRLPGEGYYFREDRFDHPGVTSLALTRRVIEHWTKPGDLVVDFFCGAGNTAVACKELDRSFIGIDSSEEYTKLTKERIK